MGDRANILLVDRAERADEPETTGIYLYTHWSGHRWPMLLQDALEAGRGRWGDEAYLARIIISNVYRDIHDQETGGGISTRRTMGDGYPVLVVDLIKSRVHEVQEGLETDRTCWGEGWSFEDYVALEDFSFWGIYR